MRILAISDLHGFIPPDQEPGDILIVAGDLTARDHGYDYLDVFQWMRRQPFTKKILVLGNHDMDAGFERGDSVALNALEILKEDWGIDYLQDSGTEFEGLKIWGTPRSLSFGGINPRCTAFTGSEADLKGFYDQIPDDTDILISHGPPYQILDKCDSGYVGSHALRKALNRVQPKILITGHIHEQNGRRMLYKYHGPNTMCYNVSYVDEYYNPVGKPIEIII